MKEFRIFLGFEFVKVGDFAISDASCKFKNWESKLIIHLYDERYKKADETTYIVMTSDLILYAGEYTYNLKERWLSKDYINHHMHDNIEKNLSDGKEISLWLAVDPFFGELNVSKSLEQEIIRKFKPEWNYRNKNSESKEWRGKNCIKLNTFVKNP